jgi:hypothetical protein
MENLVSPEYNLEAFCTEVRGKDPLAVMEVASAEISYARRLHREATKNSDFRKGSKGREYYENLQRLISLVMNGSVPAGSPPEFLTAVKPLVQQLLQKWQIGNLRQVFSNLQAPESLSVPKTIDPFVLGISRPEVEGMDTSAALGVLKKLTDSPNIAREFVERVDISLHGYDHTRQELFEIPEVRNFVYQLDGQFPFWLFFLSKRHLGLQFILFCFLAPFLTEDARSRIFPERINQLLTNQWFPAMNHICEYVGFSERQIERLTEHALAYISTGRFPLDAEPFAERSA